MSMVIIAYLVFAYLSPSTGLFNSIIEFFGGQPIDWYREKAYWPFILVLYSSGKVLALAWFYICHPSWVSARIIMRLLRLTVRQSGSRLHELHCPVKTHDYYTVDF